MKKKLLQEQREKAIIESFTKTFNKIKRPNESRLIKENHEGLVDYEVPEWALSSLINGDDSGLEDEDISKIDDFIEYVVEKHGNANFMLGDMDGEDNLGFKPNNDIDNLGSNVYRIYIKPSNEPIDEINIKKGLAGLGLAAALAGAPQKATAQMQKPEMQKTIDTTNIKTIPNDKIAINILDSYLKNPFTADMWSKGSKQNLKLVVKIKNLLEDLKTGVMDQKDLENFGAEYKDTEIAYEFINRK